METCYGMFLTISFMFHFMILYIVINEINLLTY